MSTFLRDDATFAQVRSSDISGGRSILTGNITLYVDVTNGNDSNSGLSAGVGNAWKTIQHAINVVCNSYDLGGLYSITIQCADGTYPENLTLGGYVGYGTLGQTTTAVIQGNSSNHNSVVISPASGNTITAVGVETPWTIRNLKVTSTGQGVLSDLQSIIYLDGVNFGACNIGAQALYGSSVEFSGNAYTIAGNMAVAEYVGQGGRIIHQSGATVTISGTPNFSSFFAFAQNNGVIYAPSTTYSGSATGTRFSATTNAVIDTGGGGGTYFPGNVAGSTATGGQYV